MALKKVTHEEALAELVDIVDEIRQWEYYADQLKENINKLENFEAPKKIIDATKDEYDEVISNIHELKEVYEAQKKYCKQRGWI